jgi:hypothetical protein
MKLDITIGRRVRMSLLGAERCPGLAEKLGTVVGGSVYNNSVSILIDGSKSPITLHQSYLEVLSPDDPASGAKPSSGDKDTGE